MNNSESRTVSPTMDSVRSEIDAIDDEILRLLNRRAGLAVEIGREKRRLGLPVYDPAREAALLSRLVATNPGPLSGAAVSSVFQRVVQACRNLERAPRVGVLGPRGTFSHLAATQYCGPGIDAAFYPDLADIAEAAVRGEIELGLLPAENSIEGVIGQTFDLLVEHPLAIIGEWIQPIRLYLVGSGPLEAVQTVYSHPQPLKQAQRWLRSHLPGRALVATSSTAEAAERLDHNPSAAAVVSAMLADELGLPRLAGPIEDRPDNRTRFWAVAREARRSGSKSTLLLTLPHKPGSLARALDLLGRAGVNLTSIVSRPAPQRPWEYRFFLDIEGDAGAPPASAAIAALGSNGAHVRVLGVYDSSGASE